LCDFFAERRICFAEDHGTRLLLFERLVNVFKLLNYLLVLYCIILGLIVCCFMQTAWMDNSVEYAVQQTVIKTVI